MVDLPIKNDSEILNMAIDSWFSHKKHGDFP